VTEGEDFSTASEILFTADIDSIDTNSDQRDAHLKSEDFFHAAKHAQLEFTGNKYEVKGDKAKLHGNLTIKGVSKTHHPGRGIRRHRKRPYGQTKAGFTVTGKISRKDFGLTWNAVNRIRRRCSRRRNKRSMLNTVKSNKPKIAGPAGRSDPINIIYMSDRILGLHHITAIAGNARRNLAFYTKVLGQTADQADSEL